jgi:hypothetical protein
VLATVPRCGFYSLGFMVGVPLLFAEQTGGGGRLAAVALVFGATAVTEIVTTPLMVLTKPARPLRRLYAGYVLIGASLSAMGLAATLAEPLRTPAMALCAAFIGLGNSIAGLQMITFFATRLQGDDYAAVLRLRQVMIITAMMLATAAGPLVYPALGTARTILVCGLMAALVGLAGAASRASQDLGPDFLPAEG